MLMVETPLSPEQEKIVSSTIDAGMAVHRELGPGFRERVYQAALCLELDSRGLRFDREREVVVPYRHWLIPGQRIDLIVEDVVIVEIKSADYLTALHKRQLVSYLRTAGLKVGLLMNFNTTLLKDGLRRVVV